MKFSVQNLKELFFFQRELDRYRENPVSRVMNSVSTETVGGVSSGVGSGAERDGVSGGGVGAASTQSVLPPQHYAGVSRAEILLKLKKEVVRFRTFQNWKSTAITPNILAKAGFFYFNDADKVQCAFCLGIVGGWEPTDDAFAEHKKHFPRCPFILGLPVGNLPNQGLLPDPSSFSPLTGGYDVAGSGQDFRVRGGSATTVPVRNEPIQGPVSPLSPFPPLTAGGDGAEPERGFRVRGGSATSAEIWVRGQPSERKGEFFKNLFLIFEQLFWKKQ
jgi:hypothetical protein